MSIILVMGSGKMCSTSIHKLVKGNLYHCQNSDLMNDFLDQPHKQSVSYHSYIATYVYCIIFAASTYVVQGK